MSATSWTPADRVWAAFLPRPSALRRPSDRAETLARWVALVVLVVSVPFLLAFGSSRAQDMRDVAASARATSHPVTATVTRVDLRGASAGGMSAGGVDVTATWTAPDGAVHTATGVSYRGARIGDPWSAWVDAAGRQVPPPAGESDAVTQGVLLAFWAFLGVTVALAGALALLRLALDRGRMRDWDEDWARFRPGRDHGLTG